MEQTENEAENVIHNINHLCNNNQHDEISSVLQLVLEKNSYFSILLLPSFPNCAKCIDIALQILPKESIMQLGPLDRNALIGAILLKDNDDNFEVVKKLIAYQNGEMVNMQDSMGRTAVHYAVIKGELEVLKLLVEEGKANCKHTDTDGNNLLHQFFLYNVRSTDILDYLLYGPPDVRMLMHEPNSRSKGMNTPGMYALKFNSPYTMQLLRCSTIVVDKTPSTVDRFNEVLQLALKDINDGNLNVLQQLIEKYGDSVDGNGNTLLHHLAKLKITSQVSIEHCLKNDEGALLHLVNIKNRKYESPFVFAIAGLPRTKAMFNAILESKATEPPENSDLLTDTLNYDIESFYKFYNIHKNLLFKPNQTEVTPFCQIIHLKRFDVLKVLVEDYQIDLNTLIDGQRNILHVLGIYCKDAPDIFNYIIDKVDVPKFIDQKTNNIYGYTPLLEAGVSKNVYVFSQYLERFNPDLTIKSNLGFNVFYVSIKVFDDDLLQELLKRNPELAIIPSANGEMPVMTAVRYQKISLVKLLIEYYKVDINIKDNHGNTLLHCLAYYRVKDTELIELLLNSGRNISYFINEKNNSGNTAMEIALSKDNIELFNAFSKLLTTEIDLFPEENQIEKPATKTSKELDIYSSFLQDQFWLVLREAVEKKNMKKIKKEVERLEQYSDPSDWSNNTVLHFMSCIENIDPNIIHYFLYKTKTVQCQINSKNKHGETPLHLAVLRENISVINALLSHPSIYARSQNRKGETTLLAAINNEERKFNLKVIKILITNEKSLANIPDLHGITPLQSAILRNRFSAVQYLIEEGKADLHYLDSDKDTLAHFLAGYQKQDAKMLDYLMNKPCNISKYINRCNKYGNTPLHAAAKANNIKYIQYLLKMRRIDLLRVNNMNETPLFVALSINRKQASPELIQQLVKAAPSLAMKPNFVGDLPILVALNAEHVDVIKILVQDGGIKIEKWKDKQHNTLLHYFFLYKIKDISTLEYLAQHGDRIINAQNDLGDTVMHYACKDCRLDAIHILLKSKTLDLMTTNANGETSLMNIMKENENSEKTTSTIISMIIHSPKIKLIKDKKGIYPIHKAILCRLFDVAQLILSADKNKHQQFIDHNDNNLLHYIAKYMDDNELMVKSFIAEMSQRYVIKAVHDQNKEKQTPIDVAKIYKNKAFLKVLKRLKITT